MRRRDAGKSGRAAGPVIAQLVDGLEVSWEPAQRPRFGLEPRDDLEAQLEDLRVRAAFGRDAGETPWTFEIGGADFPVRALAHGVRAARFQLESPAWLIGVARDGAPGPRAFIQFRSAYLATVGAAVAFREGREWVERHLLPLVGRQVDTDPAWRASRIDLAADVAGVSLQAADVERFTTRARQRRLYHEPAVTDYGDRVFTGFRFGRRGAPLFARIYRKDVEAPADHWVRELWRESGHSRRENPVWRVEFEIRGAAAAELRADGTWLPREPEPLLSHHLTNLWRYATRRWLVLHERASATRIERAPVERWWARLAELQDFEEAPAIASEIVRQQRPPDDAERLLVIATGLLTSYAAATGLAGWDATSAALERHVREELGRRQFARRVSQKARAATRPTAAMAPADVPPSPH